MHGFRSTVRARLKVLHPLHQCPGMVQFRRTVGPVALILYQANNSGPVKYLTSRTLEQKPQDNPFVMSAHTGIH